ncbi:MAG TPA: divalent-cation tolerance protein CutA [Thiobacillaceae bacterium]|nr:divalent-cation tolerance protein CutA [Thiobacillaceae bacterium]
MQSTGALLVLTTLPDQESAAQLARELIESRLAACVNVLSPCRSVYRWQGAIQEDEEHPLIIKTSVARYEDLEQFIRQSHPYELPEIVAVEMDRGLPAYLQWIVGETLA